MNRTIAVGATVAAILLASTIAGASAHVRRGAILGLNLGTGSSTLEYDAPNGHVKRTVDGGIAGGARLGYAFSDRLVLSLEAHGYGWDDGAASRNAGVGLLVATWYPGAGGFFLRAGVGGGRIAVHEPGIGWKDRDGGAGTVGLGYEWRVGPQFAMGLAADAAWPWTTCRYSGRPAWATPSYRCSSSGTCTDPIAAANARPAATTFPGIAAGR